MDWTGLVGKKLFLRLRSGKVYNGVVSAVDSSSPPLIFLSFKDKFGASVTVVHYEITEIREE